MNTKRAIQEAKAIARKAARQGREIRGHEKARLRRLNGQAQKDVYRGVIESDDDSYDRDDTWEDW